MAEAKRLLLLRHAKSSWEDPGLADHDRPLASRGREAARRIGAYLRDHEIEVSLVLCSSARRARETLDLVAPSGKIEIERELYGASSDQLVERLRRVPEDVKSAMLIGHNPAIQESAIRLAGGGTELARQKFPTGALVRLAFLGGWDTLDSEQAELEAFVKPRELG